ncbi:MAG TPA: beta/gamma crystallin-related protein [Rhodoferax sp.]|nr:beta/gamma crystallin-related protein [Rhodoferax sp.]
MKTQLKNIIALATLAIATQAVAQVTFYEQDYFRGQSFTTSRQVNNFDRFGFNDRASSAVVTGNRWEVCEDYRFGGRCVVLRAGRYPSLAAMGLNDRVSSARLIAQNARVDDDRYAPAPVNRPDFRRQNNERLYQADVISVRAVVGPPDQRCWIEREQVGVERGASNAPGALAGALLGGVLGHQVGGGRGKDLATVGGAIAGAAIGNQVGRNNNAPQVVTRDVQRCQEIPSQARPDFWDVTYTFRGQEHSVQLTAPPGPTLTVNRLGEPRT